MVVTFDLKYLLTPYLQFITKVRKRINNVSVPLSRPEFGSICVRHVYQHLF